MGFNCLKATEPLRGGNSIVSSAVTDNEIMAPPGEFQKENIYCRKQWRLIRINFGPGGRRKFMQPCKFIINETKL